MGTSEETHLASDSINDDGRSGLRSLRKTTAFSLKRLVISVKLGHVVGDVVLHRRVLAALVDKRGHMLAVDGNAGALSNERFSVNLTGVSERNLGGWQSTYNGVGLFANKVDLTTSRPIVSRETRLSGVICNLKSIRRDLRHTNEERADGIVQDD